MTQIKDWQNPLKKEKDDADQGSAKSIEEGEG